MQKSLYTSWTELKRKAGRKNEVILIEFEMELITVTSKKFQPNNYI